MHQPPADGEIPAGPVLGGQAEDDRSETQSVSTSSTASLTDSVREYRLLHGRTYSQKTEYWAPNDNKQTEALDFNHFWQLDYFGGRLTMAPIGDSPHHVLDVGTGTGIWAIDFADTYPSAEVIGVDISPIQPSWIPPNVKFQIDDFELDWTFRENFFDFVHIRNLEAAVADWPKLYSQAFTHTKPGGYIEVKQIDIKTRSQTIELTDDHIFSRWYKNISEATEKIGKSVKNVDDHGLAKGVKDAGFVVEEEKVYRVPIGGWSKDATLKELGALNLEFNDQSLEGFGLYLLKEVLGWEYVEVMVFVSEMRQALRDPKNQAYYNLHLVYGRKPEETQETPAA
ncbi:Secondary metabolism regulator LAE1 [Colletotrichum fructicola]|nr:Secondary metabolism regulator LAE1 [Colletotrichum fructicola]